jgi:hypothetical protein
MARAMYAKKAGRVGRSGAMSAKPWEPAPKFDPFAKCVLYYEARILREVPLFKFIERAIFGLERIADKEDRYRGRMLGYILLGLVALSVLLVLIVPRAGRALGRVAHHR